MVIGLIYCPDCGAHVKRNIVFGADGEPFWECPECGVIHPDRSWYKYVSHDEAIDIIEHRGPRGRFVEDTGIEYVGIDNTTGDAWTEEFPDLLECLMWLVDEGER